MVEFDEMIVLGRLVGSECINVIVFLIVLIFVVIMCLFLIFCVVWKLLGSGWLI